MKKIYSISALAIILMLSACGKDTPVEIVEYDDTYKVDQSKVQVDKPEKLGFNPNNIIVYKGETNIILPAYRNEEGTIVLTKTSFETSFRLKKALDKDTEIVLTEDRELLQSYTGEQLGYKPFPEGILSGTTVRIPAGQTTVTATVTVDKPEAFTEDPGYLTAFKIVVKDADSGLVPSVVSSTFFVKMDIKPALPDGDNIQTATIVPAGLTKFKGQIIPASEYQPGHLGALVDGNWWGTNWWVQSGSDTSLWLYFPLSKVKAIRFYTLTSPKRIKTVDVYASNTYGEHIVLQGTAKYDNQTSYAVIIFKEAIEIDALVFDKFVGFGDYIDIHEAEIYIEN